MRALDDGSAVEVSTTIRPERAPSARPPLPQTMSSICGELATQMKTMSELRATSALLAASRAPAASSSARRSRWRFAFSVSE